jgi:hypothetical protein
LPSPSRCFYFCFLFICIFLPRRTLGRGSCPRHPAVFIFYHFILFLFFCPGARLEEGVALAIPLFLFLFFILFLFFCPGARLEEGVALAIPLFLY